MAVRLQVCPDAMSDHYQSWSEFSKLTGYQKHLVHLVLNKNKCL